ncbi:GDYXXLXY domain-containing protein [Sphingorhabdus sp. 109]|jgi:hypothetical protein|uniref:GDYXXLXY domain-containing protein n=1 Tax=Sphingorhabdus sp. 109 TaxID=2653173 RepID=UPI0012EEF96A|nr:GDYXXLXY domain-containing protein [Sphingorhabdus sp. 109]VWX57440.1 conserved hypothetical protein [Sphingorhabdus sp. 109]
MSRYRRFFMPLALLLPLAGLALIWWITERESHQGTEWDVPIAGYDPRDLLRGHYVQFRYDWPATDEGQIPSWGAARKSLCIRGTAPEIASVETYDRIDADPLVDDRCDMVVRANPWSEEGNDGLTRDRLYVAQDAARDYEKNLVDPDLQAIARIRINNDGFITPLSLRFRPRREEENR